MLLELFALFFGIALIIVALGYYVEIDILTMTGFLFVFMLGIIVMGVNSSGVMYHDGDLLNTTASITTITPNYSYYINHTLGFFISVLGLLGFASVFYNLRKSRLGVEEWKDYSRLK